jgi:dihydroorotase-like cyclic amidohydrolase
MSTCTLIKSETLVNGGKLWVGCTFIKNGRIEKVAPRVTIEETDESIERVSAKILILND